MVDVYGDQPILFHCVSTVHVSLTQYCVKKITEQNLNFTTTRRLIFLIAPIKMSSNITIQLEDSGDAPYGGKGLKVPHGYILSFVVPCGASVASFPLELYTNYPTQPNTEFDRNHFHCVKRYI